MQSSEKVVQALNLTLATTGPDYYYWPQMTAEGVRGFADLTVMGSPMGYDYIGQVSHVTSGPAHYVDYVNFNIKSMMNGTQSIVRAHSISGIGGALGDNGQNYKNIMMAMKAAFGVGVQGMPVDGSCPSAPQHPPHPPIPQHPPLSLQHPPLPHPAQVVGTCGTESPSKVEDCQNVDFGSCGGACCKLDFNVQGTTKEVVNRLNMTLGTTGPDYYYWPQPTAEGVRGFADLTLMGSPMGFDYIGEVSHTTSGPGHYVDYIRFNIRQSPAMNGSYSVVRAHSISGIGGALSDNGQNYKNIMTAMKAAFGMGIHATSVDGSCSTGSPTFVV